MTSRGQCPRGVPVNVQEKSGGVFQIDDVTRTMSKGGCAWCSTHPSSDPPPPTWLADYGPGCVLLTTVDFGHQVGRYTRGDTSPESGRGRH